jgi:hypothetical protein
VAYLTIQKEKVKIKTKKNQFKAIGLSSTDFRRGRMGFKNGFSS